MSLQLNNIRRYQDGIWSVAERRHGMKDIESGLTVPEIKSWLGYFLVVVPVP